ncbi:hypothetical protein RCL_jg18745.t1 [Rhizophagus clarus]|uniref:Uncharacterized protein n=1 Tax=Rhizophagus clarus TaxID=94130 RepID=A0A8H3M5A9_9GLOM|nr:hypothetical protein RCL_jg18745.t1 [Rhizophagus clarus]
MLSLRLNGWESDGIYYAHKNLEKPLIILSAVVSIISRQKAALLCEIFFGICLAILGAHFAVKNIDHWENRCSSV